MNWRTIADNVSKAVQTAQQISDQASVLVQKAMTGIDTLKNASGILQSDDKAVAKGEKLVSLTAETLKKSTGERAELETCVSEEESDSTEIIDYDVPDAENKTSSLMMSNISLPCGIETAAEATKALAMMGTEIAKAVQVCQMEETKRTEIKARMEVELSRINAISNLMSDYLNKTFDERADLFDNYFKTLDKAIVSGDNELMAATLGSINSLAAQSPFKNLADLSAVQNKLGCANAEWDI